MGSRPVAVTTTVSVKTQLLASVHLTTPKWKLLTARREATTVIESGE